MKDKKCTLRPPLSLRACPVALSLPMVARVGQQRISGSLLPSLDPYFAPLRSAKHQIYATVSFKFGVLGKLLFGKSYS